MQASSNERTQKQTEGQVMKELCVRKYITFLLGGYVKSYLHIDLLIADDNYTIIDDNLCRLLIASDGYPSGSCYLIFHLSH